MASLRRSREPEPSPTEGWRTLLLDRASLAAINRAPASTEPPATVTSTPRRRKKGKSRMRLLRPVLAVFAIVLGVVTVLGLAVGSADILSGSVGRAGVLRLALLVLVAVGLLGQARSLFRMIPHPWRKPPAPPPPRKLLLLDQAEDADIATAAANLPPYAWRPPSPAARWVSSGSWFGLAIGVVGVLAVAVIGVVVSLVTMALTGGLTYISASFGFGMLAMLGVGLWATIRALMRSIGDVRLRRRKRALQRLLRAILNWLMGGGSRAGGRLTFLTAGRFAGLCTLAFLAGIAGLLPALGGDDDEDDLVAARVIDERAPTPTPTPTRPAGSGQQPPTPGSAPASGGGATPTPNGSSGGGGSGTPAPSSPTLQSGAGGSTSGGGGAPPPTASRTNTVGPGTPTPVPPTPTRTSTPTPTPTRTNTPTPTPTAFIAPPPPPPPTSTPVPTATPTRTPTPFPTSTPTPVPPTATPTTAPPTATPTPSTPCPITGSDSDGDCVSNAVEISFESNPFNKNSTPEAASYLSNTNTSFTCFDGIDNDLDGLIDGPGGPWAPNYDPWCLVIL